MQYIISGTVIKGDGYGRKLGFPTANLSSETGEIPSDGVYAGTAVLEGKVYRSGIVIGPNGKIEAHMIGYDGDAYGKIVTLAINKFIRAYKNFNSERIDYSNKRRFRIMLNTTLKNYEGPVFIIIAAFLWAFDGLIRQHLYTLPPITIIFFEHLIGLIVLSPFVFKYVLKTKLTKREWWLVILIAVLSGLLGTLWFTTALGKVHFISISVVFLLQKLQPIFAITTASIFLKEKLDKRYIKWALLAILSAYFVTFPNGIVNLQTGEGTIIAALYALGAAFAWGSSTTFSKMLLGKVDFKVSTFYRFLFTLIVALPFLFLYGRSDSALAVPAMSQFGFLALIAISTGMVALLIYYKGLAKTPVHISTILELTFPFIAILLDMIVNHTILSPFQWIASLVLVFSIYQIAQLREEI